MVIVTKANGLYQNYIVDRMLLCMKCCVAGKDTFVKEILCDLKEGTFRFPIPISGY